MQNGIEASAPIVAAEPMLYGSFPRRIQAVLLDAMLLALVLVTGASASGALTDAATGRWLNIALLALLFVYEPVLVSTTGGTLGHHAVNLRIVDAQTGRRLRFGRAFGRFMVKSIVGLVSFVVIVLTRRHQALHDVAAGAVVQIRDVSRARPGHYAIERTTADLAGPVSFGRRAAVVVAYSVALYTLFAMGTLLTLSSACIHNGICTPGEGAVSGAMLIVWLLLTVGVVVQGFRARLPGARLLSLRAGAADPTD